jgi:glycosyltransferase involved in cell wall biosynthesis
MNPSSVSVEDAHMILFLRSSGLGIDSRLQRYCRALRLGGLAHSALVWDRNGKSLGDGKTQVIRYRAVQRSHSRLGIGWRLICFNLFALRTMWRMRSEIALVHAVDMDTACAACIFQLLSGVPYIYDVYDHYPDSRGLTGWSRAVMDWLEGCVITQSARVILADAERTAQHGPIDRAKLMVVQNVPDLVQRQSTNSSDASIINLHLKIGYLGTLEPRYRGLEDVLDVVAANPCVELHIAGAGALEPLVRKYASVSKRIIFYGALDHRDGMNLLARCDILLGLYYADVANHKFAAPNKYFEHLLLGKPMLTSLGTPPGTKVASEGTGWVIADGTDGIAAALAEMHLNPDVVRKRGEAAAKLWRKNYAAYFEMEIAGHYVDAVRELTGVYPPQGQVLPFPNSTNSSTGCAV